MDDYNKYVTAVNKIYDYLDKIKLVGTILIIIIILIR